MGTLLVLVALLLAGVVVAVLATIMRFSIISSWRLRNARKRLRRPDPSSVERVCAFAPPPTLITFYRDSPLIDRVEFALVDRRQEPPRKWVIGGFYPLTGRDASEQRKTHGLTMGIPIADDLAKGVYFVAADGRILFRPAGRKASPVEVAASAQALSEFSVIDEE